MRYQPRNASATFTGLEVEKGQTMRVWDRKGGYSDFTIDKVIKHGDGCTITVETTERVADESQPHVSHLP